MVSKNQGLCDELDDLASFEREMEEERKRKAALDKGPEVEDYDSTLPEHLVLPSGSSGAKKPRGPPKRKVGSNNVI